MECFRTGTPVSVADLADAADRWPAFLPVATDREMNLFHHNPGRLPEADLVLGQALADVATIGISCLNAPSAAVRSSSSSRRPR